MKTAKKRALALFVSLCMAATLTLGACGGSGDPVEQAANDIGDAVTQAFQGDVMCEIGKEYSTKWFKFTVESLSTASSFEGYTAADGMTLVIVHVTITNTFGSTQPFGTFDWFITADSLGEDYIFPMSPLSSGMMPDNFDLADGETVTYDVVIEYPSDLQNPNFTYIELDAQQNAYATFMYPIK